MGIPALLADRVELVEEQDAGLGPDVVEEPTQPCVRLSKVAPNQRIVSDDEERQGKRLGDSLGIRCLSVSGRPGQQETMPRLVAVSSQDIRASVFLDELPTVFTNRQVYWKQGKALVAEQWKAELRPEPSVRDGDPVKSRRPARRRER